MADRGGSTFPLLKSSWDAAFRAVRESANPYTGVQLVSQAAVSGVPNHFQEVTENTVVPTYHEPGPGDSFRIQDWGVVYTVSLRQGTEDTLSSLGVADGQAGLVDASQSVPAEGSSSVADQSKRDSGLTPAQKAVGGAVLLYAGYKGLQALGAALGSESTQDDTGFSQLAHAANRLENKQYKIFISHSWTYDEHYERIVDFLDDVPSLDWQNHSVPSTDPLTATNDEDLKQELRKQIQPASVVVVSAGMYGAYSKWIEIELDLAEKFDKPVIAIVPEGQERVPSQIQESATVQVGWRQASLIDALADHG